MIVYALCDPGTEEVRYVGQTCRTVQARIHEHFTRGRAHVNTWIRSLGRGPSYFILEECETREELNEAERFWIDWYRRLGARLCNHSSGGEGSAPHNPRGPKRRTAEHNRKIGEALQGRTITWGDKIAAANRRRHAHSH